jgi:hypothetical protein
MTRLEELLRFYAHPRPATEVFIGVVRQTPREELRVRLAKATTRDR